MPGSPSTADGTGAVMQALSPDSKAVHRGLSYLRKAQRTGGGFPLGGNGAVNSQSTAWAIQGILAAGGNPDGFRRGGVSAPEYLAAQQQCDGHYRYSDSSDQTPVWVTGESLVAAAGDYFPVSLPPRVPTPSSSRLIPGVSTAPSTPPPVSSATELPARLEAPPLAADFWERRGADPSRRFAAPGPASPGAPASGFCRGSREGGVLLPPLRNRSRRPSPPKSIRATRPASPP